MNPTNPYAPPASETALHLDESPTKRPASVKWTLVLVWLLLGAFLFSWGEAIVEGRWQAMLKSYITHPVSVWRLLPLAGSILFAFGGRRVFAYFAGVLVLGLYGVFLGLALVIGGMPQDGAEALGRFIGMAIIGGPLLWLFCRFTFGRPSRVYYRLVKK